MGEYVQPLPERRDKAQTREGKEQIDGRVDGLLEEQ